MRRFTEERFLPKLMVEAGIVKSISEVRRNQPKLMVSLDKVDYLEIKWGKKRLFIGVGKSLIRKQLHFKWQRKYGERKSYIRAVSMQQRTENRSEDWGALGSMLHDEAFGLIISSRIRLS